MDTVISNIVLEKIKIEVESLTPNPQIQQILIDFAYSQVLHAQKILVENSRRLIGFEFQVMMILEKFILKEFDIESIRVRTKEIKYILPKHTFCYLSDYFLNCLHPKSKFAKHIKKNNLTKSSNTRNIAKYLQLKQHGTILNAITKIQDRIYTDKIFKQEIVLIKYKAETLLNSCYILD